MILITSGYFDPIHVGHIECFALAKEMYPAAKLLVIVNNDEQARLKKGKSFMPEKERLQIVKSIRYVDEVYLSIDTDKSVTNSLEDILKFYKHRCFNTECIFIKGGDRFASEIPEKEILDRFNVKIVDGIGEKIRSSSELTGLRAI